VLEEFSNGGTVTVDFENIERGTSAIIYYANKYPLKAIIGVDDETTLVAATACRALGLRGNDPDAVAATRNKFQFRTRMANSGIRSPQFSVVKTSADPRIAARGIAYPVVLKPLALSASRGVIRADTEDEFATAFRRIRAILQRCKLSGNVAEQILVESYIRGQEVALEGILEDGKLQVLALFDKPDPLEGPFFEETIYVTPSRLPDRLQETVYSTVSDAVSKLGLYQGAIHAELRINPDGVWLIEVAARSIGGHCGRSLQFGVGSQSLEELILHQAIGEATAGNLQPPHAAPYKTATGVMMIPIPMAGRLRGVEGIDAARASQGIEDVTINIGLGENLVPVPEGNKYLGFIFAKGTSPGAVEANLRRAHDLLKFIIEPEE
jgi:hypothetical protein